MRSRGRRRIIAEVESIKVQTLVVTGLKEIVPVTFPDGFLTLTPNICAQISAQTMGKKITYFIFIMLLL